MRIVHNVSLRADREDQRRLAEFGLKVNVGQVLTMRIDEVDPRWAEVAAWIEQRKPTDIVWTEFTKQEVDNADWVELSPQLHRGYPEPEDEYETVTYGGTGCRACGVGRTQVAAFRFREEPRWGRDGILQLNWVFDEYFVRPDVWEGVFRPLNVPCRRVLSRRGDRELDRVVQLIAAEQAPLVLDGARYVSCPVCGQRKYLPHRRGPFPSLESEPSSNYIQSSQWFGDGRRAYRAVIASKEVVRALDLYGVKGVAPWPLMHSP